VIVTTKASIWRFSPESCRACARYERIRILNRWQSSLRPWMKAPCGVPRPNIGTTSPASSRALHILASERISFSAGCRMPLRRAFKITLRCSMSMQRVIHDGATRCGSICRSCAESKRRIPKRMCGPNPPLAGPIFTVRPGVIWVQPCRMRARRSKARSGTRHRFRCRTIDSRSARLVSSMAFASIPRA
jgi:hypothetical protein